MDKDELKTLVQSKIKNALGYQGGELSYDRQQLLDAYLGEPYGNEREGRSSVVTREVLETVEWIKPSLMRVFMGGNKIVEFDATGPDDRQAMQETEYCNYVFFKENNGFMESYNWITDALLQRTGVIKVWWEESTEVTTENYQGLNELELLQVDSTEDYEITAHTDNGDGTYDIEVKVTSQAGKHCIEAMPPEEFLIDRDANNLDIQKARFACHRSKKTISDLIAMGYDRDLVEKIGSDDDRDFHDETINRNFLEDEQNYSDEQNDPVMREVEYFECYVRADFDDDGIAELRKVCLAGNEVLENDEADHIPFVALSSLPLPHKFTGLCVADLVKDIQLIKTTITRQYLDALYQANNPRLRADPDLVSIEDLLTPRPGQVVRGKAGGVEPIPNQAAEVVGSAMPALQALDQIKESRTGVSRHTMGLDADAIAKSTKGAFNRALDEANARIEMIARIFAETGFKELFRLIREVGIKYDAGRNIKLGKEWVDVNPQSWKKRENMTVHVGLGTNNKDTMVQTLMMVIQEQKEHLAQGSPITQPAQLYNAYEKLVETVGLKDATPFFTNPSTLPPPTPPNPEDDPQFKLINKQIELEQLKLQQKQIDQQNRLELERYKAELKRSTDIAKMELEFEKDIAAPGIGAELNAE